MIYYLFNTLAYAKSIYSRPQNSLIPRLAKKYKISEMKKYHNLFPAPTAKKFLLTLRRSCSKNCGVLIEATASMYIKLDFYKYFFFNISSVFSKCIRAPSHQKMHYCHLQGPRNLQRASTLKFQLKATKDSSHLRENA